MVKIKKIHLQRYCGYKDVEFDFTKGNKIKELIAFFGPNGCGKSSCLEAIHLLCNAKRLQNMDTSVLLRKLTFHNDYNPVVIDKFLKAKEPMIISGIFATNAGDKEVIIHSNKGVVKNELPYSGYGHCYYIDADNPMNMSKFQLHDQMKETFLDMAKTVYGYECELQNEVDALGNEITEEQYKREEQYTTGEIFYTDLVINKIYSQTKVHFKRMSAGEKKIATLLRDLCNPEYINNIDIVLIDNVAMHIYFKRHRLLIDKLLKVFPDKQFIVTTHSGIIVENLDDDYLYDIERYKKVEFEKRILEEK